MGGSMGISEGRKDHFMCILLRKCLHKREIGWVLMTLSLYEFQQDTAGLQWGFPTGSNGVHI